jgi:hypothetical protein
MDSWQKSEMFGWHDSQEEVEMVCGTLPTPFFAAPSPEKGKDSHLHILFKKTLGFEAPMGPQQIGDCVSWGSGNFVNYMQMMHIHHQIQELIAKGTPQHEIDIFTNEARYAYQEACTEAIYALSRVEIGGGRIRGDGSVGAWAGKALEQFGAISRPHLKELGLDPTYSGQRARSWGSRGLPDELETHAKAHPFEEISLVRNFEEFAWHCQQGRPTFVCSNVGFENGPGGRTQRDAQGFARAQGTWPHCMTLVSLRWDRPGALCLNQGPESAFMGPLAFEQPKQSFWIDADTVDRMLRQQDSWTGDRYRGYPVRKLTWKH